MLEPDSGDPTLTHQHFLDQARTLPKVDVNDPRVQTILAAAKTGNEAEERKARKVFGYFGHNFIGLFQEMRTARINLSFDLGAIRQAKALGEPWHRFLTENENLLGRIEKVLEEADPYRQLRYYQRDLYLDRRFADGDALNDATGHPLGITAISYFFIDKMNPLLREAFDALRKNGINSTNLAIVPSERSVTR